MSKDRAVLAVVAMFACACGFAQQAPQQQAPVKPQPPTTQAPAQPATPSSQGNAAQPRQSTAAPENPSGPVHHAPQAKSQDEFAAYQQVIQQADLDAAAAAADQFAAKYPQSELRAPLYQEVTRRYFSSNKADQVLMYGRKTLELEPNNPLALSMVARVLAERTQENDIDHDERLNEAIRDAEKMIATIDQSLPDIIPSNVSPEQAEGVKRQLLFMAWDAEGKAQMELKQDAKAQASFEKALQYAPDEARTRFRLALALDRQGHYPEALTAIDRALQGAQGDAALMQQAQQEKARLQQLTGAASANPEGSAPAKPPSA